MAAKKSEYKTYSCYTDKQVNAMKKKLAAAIREATKVIDQKNPMAQPYASLLKKYRKMLQDANNYLGWSVAPKAQDKPSMRIKNGKIMATKKTSTKSLKEGFVSKAEYDKFFGYIGKAQRIGEIM